MKEIHLWELTGWFLRGLPLELPFIGNFSNLTGIKIKQLSRCFCKDLNIIKVVFTSYRLKLRIFSVLKILFLTLLNPLLSINYLIVRDVTPVILVRLLAIFQQGSKSTLIEQFPHIKHKLKSLKYLSLTQCLEASRSCFIIV